MRPAFAVLAVLTSVTLPACSKDPSRHQTTTEPAAAAAQSQVALPSASASAEARQRFEQEVEAHFKETDKNGDGKVTRDEATSVASERFAEMDTNKDGSLDAVEIAVSAERDIQRRAGDRIRELDRNGDGKLTRDEAAPGMLAHFERYDTDGDGAITLDEVMKATAPRGGRPRSSPLALLDTDGDGLVSAQEHARAPMEWFDRADTNHDGAVTLEEAKAALPKDPRAGMQPNPKP